MRTEQTLIHWNYFLALESDLANVSRYIEFNEDNFDTYSIELSHLLLASSSEVDVVLKGICKYLEPEAKPWDIADSRKIIMTRYYPEFHTQKVFVPRFNLSFSPWKDWETDASPFWWTAYNNVKHHRSEHFAQANLQNVLNSMGGLLVSVFYFYGLQFGSEGIPNSDKEVTDQLKDVSGFMKLNDMYYRGHLMLN